jgi:hypothetical protein
METIDPAAHGESEEHRRLKVAHAIYEENSGPIHKVFGETRHHPLATVAIAVLLGIAVGVALFRD